MALNIGLVLSADYFPVRQLLEFAPSLESMGYSQFSVPEIWGHDAISLLSVLAVKTKRARIATGIINIFSRTPALLAMTAASLDELSGGRFVLGIGVSGPKVIENWHGMPFKKPLRRTREVITVIRSILREERQNMSSELIGEIKDFKISFHPIRKEIPIHVASLGPKNIALTAELADGWIPVFMPHELFEGEIRKINDIVKKHDRDPESFEVTPFVLAAIGDLEKTKFLLKKHLAYYFGGMGDFYNNMLRRAGFEEEAQAIKENWLQGDRVKAQDMITDEILEATTLFGDAREAREKLYKMQKKGATMPLISLPFYTPFEIARSTFEALAPVNDA